MALILGEKITVESLLLVQAGAEVSLERDAYDSLSTADAEPHVFPEDSRPLNTAYIKPAIVIGTHHLLKAGDKTRVRTIEQIMALLPNSEIPSSLLDVSKALQLSASETEIMMRPGTEFASALGVMIGDLQRVLPAAQCAFALYLEAEAFNAGFITVKTANKKIKGAYDVIENLEMLLVNSKLARKNYNEDAVHIIETPQNLGELADICIEGKRLVEIQVNAKAAAGKFKPGQSLAHLGKVATNLTYIISLLHDDGVKRLGLESPNPVVSERLNFRDSDRLAENLVALSLLTKQYVDLVGSELKFAMEKLAEQEERINEGQTRKRPLALGKGTKPLYEKISGASLAEGEFYQVFADHIAAKNQERRVPKLPKGTRDFGITQMAIREKAFSIIKGVFQRHCAGEIDTPVFELKETLLGKYGDEGDKLVYDLADQGGEILSLRYDLTVPFARYVAMNRISRIKRFHIAKVYRRDQPQMTKGRYREFYQCDFDIAGVGGSMFQDAEILTILNEILTQLKIGQFMIKINHRCLLDAYLEISGVPEKKFRTVTSSIDKLDKTEWAEVRHELMTEKGLDMTQCEALEQFVKIKGNPREVHQQLIDSTRFAEHKVGTKALNEMGQLIQYATALGAADNLSFDLSLARGLDYYTGLIYEAVLMNSEFGVGSIAGGGRYDQLIMKLNNSKTQTPAIGVSIGIERVISILEKKQEALYQQRVLVAQAGNSKTYNLVIERLKLCKLLWDNGINAETSYKEKSDPQGQTTYALENYFTMIVWIGEGELENGQVKVKHLESHQEDLIPMEQLVENLKSR